jgi:DNA-directed RNA polymerase subunit alpha
LSGGAVEAFKIKGVQHEFGAIDGVQEDVVEIMLNLKQLAVKVFGDEPVTLNLIKKGPGVVTAGDITKDSNVEVINKDLVICHLTSNKSIEMEIIVGRGQGFVPVEEKDKKNYPLGTIVTDSIYTPVKDVGYRVEYTRVGDITNYEKLTVNIETNGTISPEDAVHQSVQILIDHFSIILNNVSAPVSAPVTSAPAEENDEEEIVEEAEEKAKKKGSKKK